ncbi:adenosylcobinamide-GDP ribazoletransferase [Halocynthiibacter sp. C4]|uniref:adenosylcobinamide-GDP ribazoletransferase n=1 Tax=Halocynthiibacter sp. C4 TaxID=2992758 RepID=UPI00237AA6B3|nr:adenosylcobinamide-GDP ribazoletransferase [Halocynthiibacter sp. C4]MDE0589060.1 adenosylcobinamide-GDP ribazoletransferase [Halocynthiibacter sp. C4]
MSLGDKHIIQGNDILFALGFLSRLPVQVNTEAAQERGAAAAWAYPVAGAVIGFIAVLAGALAGLLALPEYAVSAVILATLMMLSGALHEDGLADTFDGLWGAYDAENRLLIMKDSRVGTYGVLALGLSLITKFALIHALVSSGAALAIVGAAALSRAPMVMIMSAIPNARRDGISRNVGRPQTETALLAIIAGISISFLFSGPLAMLHGVVLITCASAVLAYVAQQKIGGQTGDILGASQQISEVILLATCVTAFAV